MAIYLYLLFVIANGAKIAVFHKQISITRVRGVGVVYALCSSLLKAALLFGPVLILGPVCAVATYVTQLAYIVASLHFVRATSTYYSLASLKSKRREASQTVRVYAREKLRRSAASLFGSDYYVLLDAPLLLVTAVVPVHSSLAAYLAVTIAAAVALFGVTVAGGLVMLKGLPLFRHYPNDMVTKVRIFGLFGWQVVDAMQSSTRVAIEIPNERYCTSARGSRRNVVIIQLESIDSAIVQTQYDGKYIMPYLSGLRARSSFFPYMLSCRGGGGTSDCELSIINSAEVPESFEVTRHGASLEYPNSIFNVFKAAGYAVNVYHGNTRGFYNRGEIYPLLGAQFHDRIDMQLPEHVWGALDADVLNYAATNIGRRAQPHVSMVITMSTHSPFNLVNGKYVDARFADIDDAALRGYYTACSYLDACLEQFVAKCMDDNTAMILYGDHGPGLRSGVHRESRISVAGRTLVFTPLYILAPGAPPHWDRSRAVSFADVAPSLLSVSGIGGSIQTHGASLYNNSPSGWIKFRDSEYDRLQLYNLVHTFCDAVAPTKVCS